VIINYHKKKSPCGGFFSYYKGAIIVGAIKGFFALNPENNKKNHIRMRKYKR